MLLSYTGVETERSKMNIYQAQNGTVYGNVYYGRYILYISCKFIICSL